MLGGPELGTVLLVRFAQCCLEEKVHLFWPAGSRKVHEHPKSHSECPVASERHGVGVQTPSFMSPGTIWSPPTMRPVCLPAVSGQAGSGSMSLPPSIKLPYCTQSLFLAAHAPRGLPLDTWGRPLLPLSTQHSYTTMLCIKIFKLKQALVTVCENCLPQCLSPPHSPKNL